MVDKRIKYVLYILMIISLFFSIKNKVNAAQVQNYEIFNGRIKGNLCRLLGNDVNNFDITPNNGSDNIDCSFSTGLPYQEIRLFFNTETYWGYTDRFANFSGTAEFGTANATIISASILNGNGNIIGSCNTNTNSTGQITSWSAQCWVPSGLNSGNYTNILSLRLASMNSPANALTGNLSFSRYVPIYDNYYISKNGNSDITNAINNQTQQQHQDAQNTQQKIEDTNNTIKDSSTDNNNMNSTFNSLNNQNASNNTISSLLLMPITLLQKILNAFNGSCSAINTGQILGTDFILPCIDISSLIGSTLWNIIDVICSGFLAFKIGKRFVVIFNQFTNLKEGGLESAYD